MKLIKAIFSILILLNCFQGVAASGASANSSINVNKPIAEENKLLGDSIYPEEWLDEILVCAEYDFMGDSYGMPDFGCQYGDFRKNKIGNIVVYLLPKSGYFTDNKFDKEQEVKNINKLGLEYIKKNYNAYISVIDKKFLKYISQGESGYAAEYPYEEALLKNTGNGWSVASWRSVNNDDDWRWDSKWRGAYIKSQNTNNSPLQCLEELNALIVDYYPSYGVDYDYKRIYVSRNTDNILGVSVYYVKRLGSNGNGTDRSKKAGYLGYAELHFDSASLYFVASPFEEVRRRLKAFDPGHLYNFKECDFSLYDLNARQTNIYMKVISQGRTYFYEYPNSETQIKNIFLIPSDKVEALLQLGDFTYVSYTQKSGNQVKGWLKSEDLMEIPFLDHM